MQSGRLIAAGVQFDTNRLQRLELDYQASGLGTAPQAAAQLRVRDLAIGDLPAASAALQAAYEGSRQSGDVYRTIDPAASDGKPSGGACHPGRYRAARGA